MINEVVIDSGVTVKWFVDETYTAPARRIRDDYRAGVLDLLAPDLIYAEFGNIMWKKRIFGGMSEADVQAALATFQTYPLKITPAKDLLEEAYQLAVAHRRTVYDSLYLALSLRVNCRFVTADEKFANAVGSSFPNVVWLANWG